MMKNLKEMYQSFPHKTKLKVILILILALYGALELLS